MKTGQLVNENKAYRQARAELLETEISLRDQRERVAELRRKLPMDTEVEDYILHEGPTDLNADTPVSEVRLSELFTDPDKPLVVYQFMLGGAQKELCPMCTMWTDGYNAVVHHLRQRMNFAIVAQAKIEELRHYARQRGWQNLRFLSCDGSSFKDDLHFQDDSGNQFPGVSVFTRSADGSLRHFYSGSAIMKENEFRGIDLFTPVWHFLDLTPAGREDWMPSLNYK